MEDETLFLSVPNDAKGVTSSSFRAALGSSSSQGILCHKAVLENQL